MNKGIKKIIIGGALFLVAMVLPFAIFIPIFFMDSGDTTLKAPGSAEITIEEPGTYYLWNNYSTVLDGKSYSASEELPDGMNFSLIGKTSGEKITMEPYLNMSSSSGSNRKRSVGYFELSEPGQYILEVTGNSKTRIFSFGKSFFDSLGMTMVGLIVCFFLAFAAAIGAIILIILGIIDIARESGKSQKKTEPEFIDKNMLSKDEF